MVYVLFSFPFVQNGVRFYLMKLIFKIIQLTWKSLVKCVEFRLEKKSAIDFFFFLGKSAIDIYNHLVSLRGNYSGLIDVFFFFLTNNRYLFETEFWSVVGGIKLIKLEKRGPLMALQSYFMIFKCALDLDSWPKTIKEAFVTFICFLYIEEYRYFYLIFLCWTTYHRLAILISRIELILIYGKVCFLQLYYEAFCQDISHFYLILNIVLGYCWEERNKKCNFKPNTYVE